MVDAWFNSQTRKNAFGQTELFHYKWSDDSNNGYSFFGRAFRRHGVTLATLPEAPTAAALAHAQIYVIASPGYSSRRIPTRTTWTRPAATPSRPGSRRAACCCSSPTTATTPSSPTSIRSADRFGIHFNPVLSHHVIGPDHSTGEVVIPPGTGHLRRGFTAYMKDTSTITVSGPAKALVTDHGDVMIAVRMWAKGQSWAWSIRGFTTSTPMAAKWASTTASKPPKMLPTGRCIHGTPGWENAKTVR